MKIVIVGGVAGGMSAAARARRLDETAEIVVFERGEYVSFANCGLPYHVAGEIEDRDSLLLHTPESLRRTLNLDVRVNSTVTAIDRAARTVAVSGPEGEYAESYDALLLSPGAEPMVPPIEGVSTPGVHQLYTLPQMDGILADLADGAHSALVVGAGFIGLEAVEALRERGLDVTLVEFAPHVLPPLPDELAPFLQEELEAHGVQVITGAGVTTIQSSSDAGTAEAARARGLSEAEGGDETPHASNSPESVVLREASGSRTRTSDQVQALDSATTPPAPRRMTKSEAGDGRMTVTLSNGSELSTDLVLLSTGVAPRSELARAAGLELGERGAIVVDAQMRTSDPHIWAVGDAVQVRQSVAGQDVLGPVPLAAPANRHGRLAADSIVRSAQPAQATHDASRVEFRSTSDVAAPPAVLGTAIVRVFGQVAAVTGAQPRTLDRLGIEHITVSVHPNSHAGYYPGAEQIHLLASFAPDGTVLGAAAVGRDGVDKRIDVLATAIKAAMTADDLADLDLAYSPPFGSAKDAVNMLAFTAQNILNGTMPAWRVADLDDAMSTGLILDVRSAAECKKGMVQGAINIPHTELRARIDEVREAAAGRPVFVHCASGVRSYLGTRILIGNGIDARNLLGGAITLQRNRPDAFTAAG
ncbi:Rhodanese-like domain-containing protein [Ruaniaceae bacterium KH17]|nr:Rhodanese-like domain-containing protein [Ruaniaceae bacterium KH17]